MSVKENFKAKELTSAEVEAGQILDTHEGDAAVRALAASDLPKSQVITALSRRVREAELASENWNYTILKYVAPAMRFDGTFDRNWSELKTSAGQKPYGDTTFDAAFGKSHNGAVRKTYVAETENNLKTSILKDDLINFRTNPSDSIGAVFKSTENIMKDNEKFTSEQAWDVIANELVYIDVLVDDITAPEAAIELDKAKYEYMIELGKNSKTHAVGTDRVGAPGVITDGTDSVQPTYKFDSGSLVDWTVPSHQANIEYVGNRPYFNWKGKQRPLAGTEDLFIGEEGMSTAAVTALNGVSSMLVDKDFLFGVMDWKGTGVANTGQMEDNFHSYMNQDIYAKEEKIIVAFRLATAPVKSTKDGKNKTIKTVDLRKEAK